MSETTSTNVSVTANLADDLFCLQIVYKKYAGDSSDSYRMCRVIWTDCPSHCPDVPTPFPLYFLHELRAQVKELLTPAGFEMFTHRELPLASL